MEAHLDETLEVHCPTLRTCLLIGDVHGLCRSSEKVLERRFLRYNGGGYISQGWSKKGRPT
jgi:hypothetical protein